MLLEYVQCGYRSIKSYISYTNRVRQWHSRSFGAFRLRCKGEKNRYTFALLCEVYNHGPRTYLWGGAMEAFALPVGRIIIWVFCYLFLVFSQLF